MHFLTSYYYDVPRYVTRVVVPRGVKGPKCKATGLRREYEQADKDNL
jgi:hypothetical protein